MRNLRFPVRMFLIGVMLLGAGAVSGQDYPNKPIRIITSGIGSGTDFVARLIAQGINSPLGQPLIVDNRAGVVPSQTVANASPDGYTLFVQGVTHWMAPLLLNTPYDPVKDFSPITIFDRSPSVIIMHPSVAVNSVKELIALAKSKPGQLNFGSNGGPGNIAQLSGELFSAMASVKMVHVNYKVAASLISDMIAGRVHMRFGSGSSLMPLVAEGKLRALAVASAQPSPLYPSLPTVAASGLPGYEAVSVTSAFAPANTPAPIIRRLNQEIVRVAKTEDVKTKLFNTGAEAVGSSPAELAALMKSDMVKFGKVIKDAGIKVD